MLRGRKGSLPYLAHVVLGGADDGVADLGESLGELGHPAARHPEHVVTDEHLAIAVGAGPDADGGNGNGVGHDGGQIGRDRFEHDGVGASLGEGLRVGDEFGRSRVGFALHLEAAEGVYRLRGEPDVAHDVDDLIGDLTKALDAV